MKKKIVAFLMIFGSAFTVYSQDEVNDAGLWTTFNVEKRLTDKFSVFLTEEFRLRDNFSRINLFYTDLGIEYRPLKFLKVAFAYRLTEKNQFDGYSYRHRAMLDITLKKKLGNFALSYRHRLQREIRNMNTSEFGILPEWYSRNKITLKYDFGKQLVPYIAVELRYQILNPRSMESDALWHRSRYIAGVDYKRNNRDTFGLYYLVQNEFNVSVPQNVYIVGLEYSLSF